MQFSGSDRPARVGVSPSYRELRRQREAQEKRWQVEDGRRGILGAWLNLTAPPPASSLASLAERERLRKAELSAYVLFGILLMGIALIPNGLVNTPTLFSAGIITGSAILAGLLNRSNHTFSAAIVLIGAFSVALVGAMGAAPYLDLMWMPALDFFAVPVLLAGLLLTRRAPFVVAGLGAAAVALLLELKPRDAALGAMVAQLGVYHFMVRPIALMLIVAIASWLWSRSVEQAITRADRAEEVAAMEHQLAEQKQQLDRGIQSLLETHVRVANGDFSARAATSQDNVLWQIAVSLNTLLARLGKYATIEQRLQRTEQEIEHVAVAMERARAGRPINWPATSGTRVDRLLRVVAGTARLPAMGANPAAFGAPASSTSSASSASPFASRHYGAGHFDAAGPTRTMPTGAWPSATPPRETANTPPITGKWREVSGLHTGPFPSAGRDGRDAASARDGRDAASARDGRDAASARDGRSPWAASQPPNSAHSYDPFAWSFPPASASLPHEPLFGLAERPAREPSVERSTPRPASERATFWEMDPLPPLPPTPHEPSRPGAGSRQDGFGGVSDAPRVAEGDATQSQPSQLGGDPDGDQRQAADGEQQLVDPAAAPAPDDAREDDWPDWPAYLKSLANQPD